MLGRLCALSDGFEWSYGVKIILIAVTSVILLGVVVLLVLELVGKRRLVVTREEEPEEEEEEIAVAEEPEPEPVIIPEPVKNEEIELTEDAVLVDDGDDADTGTVVIGATQLKVRYNRSFTAKLIQADDVLKARYSELKNELMRYSMKPRISWSNESFYKGRTTYAKFAIRGKTLSLYLALDPAEFADTKYFFENASDVAKYEQVPMRLKLKSDRSVKWAKELIAILAEKNGLERADDEEKNFKPEYRPTSYLVIDKLIKLYYAGERVILPTDDTYSKNKEAYHNNGEEVQAAEEAAVTAVEEPTPVISPEVEKSPAVVEEQPVEEVIEEQPEEPVEEVVEETVEEKLSPVISTEVEGSPAEEPVNEEEISRQARNDIEQQPEEPVEEVVEETPEEPVEETVEEELSPVIPPEGLPEGLHTALEKVSYDIVQSEAEGSPAEEPVNEEEISRQARNDIEQQSEEPVEEVAEEQPEDTVEEPVEELVEEQPEETVEEPVEEVIEEQPEEPVEEVAEEPVEELPVRDFEILEEISASEVEEVIGDEEAKQLIEEEIVGDKKHPKPKKFNKGIVNVDSLSKNFEAGEHVTLDSLHKKKIIASKINYFKVLADGKLDKALIVEADDFSLEAAKMILITGGRVIKKKYK